ncbi:hypothetical protein BLOT_010692, partial [Blomia tropicalis]
MHVLNGSLLKIFHAKTISRKHGPIGCLPCNFRHFELFYFSFNHSMTFIYKNNPYKTN